MSPIIHSIAPILTLQLISFLSTNSTTAVLQVALLHQVMDLVDTHNKAMEVVTLNNSREVSNSKVAIHNKEVITLLNNHNKHTEANKDTTDNHNHNPFMFNNQKRVVVVRLRELVAVLVWLVHVYVVVQKR